MDKKIFLLLDFPSLTKVHSINVGCFKYCYHLLTSYYKYVEILRIVSRSILSYFLRTETFFRTLKLGITPNFGDYL